MGVDTNNPFAFLRNEDSKKNERNRQKTAAKKAEKKNNENVPANTNVLEEKNVKFNNVAAAKNNKPEQQNRSRPMNTQNNRENWQPPKARENRPTSEENWNNSGDNTKGNDNAGNDWNVINNKNGASRKKTYSESRNNTQSHRNVQPSENWDDEDKGLGDNNKGNDDTETDWNTMNSKSSVPPGQKRNNFRNRNDDNFAGNRNDNFKRSSGNRNSNSASYNGGNRNDNLKQSNGGNVGSGGNDNTEWSTGDNTNDDWAAGGNQENKWENKSNEYGNNVQSSDFNRQNSNKHEHSDHRPRRQSNDRNFGNRRPFDGRTGKREYDRQSGSYKTGVKAVDKREGGGAHNWGTHKQDMEDLKKEANSDTDLKDDWNTDANTNSNANATANESDAPIEKEKEVVTMTLDEYKAAQNARAKPQYVIRKAGEGEDAKKWGKMVPLENRKQQKDKNSEHEYENDPTMNPQRVGKKKYFEDTQFKIAGQPTKFNRQRRFNDRNAQDKGGDGRNDRKGGYVRNDNQRGNARPKQNAPEIDDRNFPSLG